MKDRPICCGSYPRECHRRPFTTRGPGDSVCKFLLFEKFRVLNFRGLLRPQKIFNNKNFPIYGISLVFAAVTCDLTFARSSYC